MPYLRILISLLSVAAFLCVTGNSIGADFHRSSSQSTSQDDSDHQVLTERDYKVKLRIRESADANENEGLEIIPASALMQRLAPVHGDDEIAAPSDDDGVHEEPSSEAPPPSAALERTGVDTVQAPEDHETENAEGSFDTSKVVAELDALLEQQQLTEAKEVFRRAVECCGRWQVDELLLAYGRLLMRCKAVCEAREVFLEALSRRPRCSTLLRSMAALEAEDGRFEEAVTAYERALREDPRNADTLSEYASLLNAHGAPEARVRTLLDLALSAHPGHSAACANYASLLEASGDRLAAEHMYRAAAVGLLAQDASPPSGSGCGSTETGDKGLEGEVKLNGRGQATVLNNLACFLTDGPDCADDMGRAAEAVRALERAVAVAPGHAAALSNLASLLLRTCNHSEEVLERAEELLQRATQADPSDIGTLEQLAQMLEGRRAFLPAEELLHRILALLPDPSRPAAPSPQDRAAQAVVSGGRKSLWKGRMGHKAEDGARCRVLCRLGALKEASGEWPKAREAYTAALASSRISQASTIPGESAVTCGERENHAKALCGLAVATWVLEEEEDAFADEPRRLLRTALEILPSHVPSLMASAAIAASLEDLRVDRGEVQQTATSGLGGGLRGHAEALDLLQRVLELEPNNEQALAYVQESLACDAEAKQTI